MTPCCQTSLREALVKSTVADHVAAVVGPPNASHGRIGPVVTDFVLMQALHNARDYYQVSTPSLFHRSDVAKAVHTWLHRLDGPSAMPQAEVESVVAFNLSPSSLAVLLEQCKPRSRESSRDHVEMLINAAIKALARADADAEHYAEQLLGMRVVLGKLAVRFFEQVATRWNADPVPVPLRLPALLDRTQQ